MKFTNRSRGSALGKRALGFNLIELMIVVALIGTLAAIAMTAYTSYISTSQMSVVNAHFDTAKRFVHFKYALVASEVANGTATNPPVPDNAAGWIAIISDYSELAPGGGPTYISGTADPTTGAVGIDVTGTYAAGDVVVSITRPAYRGLTEQTAVVPMS